MRINSFKRAIYAFILVSVLFVPSLARAQEQQTDSLVRLIEAKSAQLLEINGQSYRKVVGTPARFLHNNTFLLCDTALWNVDTQVLDAYGNVSIIQDGTVLTSDKMLYFIDRDLAQFRGNVVQLQDRDRNTLRTRYLDYNTKDSVAVFMNGGSMRDKDGQIIESRNGTYDSKIQKFTFSSDVNMFTDSIFVKTSNLVYESELNLATFGRGTDAWQDDNMLSANAGWYDRGRELFFFRNAVHIMTDTQEGWCDSLYFHRNTMDVEMLGRAQITDTTRNVSAVGGRISYIDSLSKVTLTREPAVISSFEDNGRIDTVYFGADTMIYRTVRYCDIDSLTLVNSEKRLADLDVDPVSIYRRKSAEEAARAAEEAAKNDPNYRPPVTPGKSSGKTSDKTPDISSDRSGDNPPVQENLPEDTDALSSAGQDSLAVKDTVTDSLSVSDSLFLADPLAAADSLAAGIPLSAADSLAVSDTLAVKQLDTTEIGFLTALRNVKLYRDNMQIVCDSLEYSDLDSLARLFKDPIIWNEVTQQYSADSITAVIRGQAMEKASLMSEAFIHIQEDESHFDQIKSTEMIAYFNEEGGLDRFDALGGAFAVFFIKEQDVLATVNKKESKMLSASFKDGNMEKVYYYDAVKSDAYPLAQMAREEQVLKGFRWEPDKRPEDRYAVTSLELKPLERSFYSRRPRARFTNTDIYFPGYMSDIYVQIAVRDSLAKVRAERRRMEEAFAAKAEADSLAALKDSLSYADSLSAAGADSLALKDSIAVADSISLAAGDSLAVNGDKVLTKEQLREQAAAERKAKKEQRNKEKEERWARLDQADADKAAAKQAKRDAKLRERKRKMLEAAEKQARKDAEVLNNYIRRLELKAARKEARKAKKKNK